jgi:hypothetical protein
VRRQERETPASGNQSTRAAASAMASRQRLFITIPFFFDAKFWLRWHCQYPPTFLDFTKYE